MNNLLPVAEVWKQPISSLSIKLIDPRHSTHNLDSLVAILKRHPGSIPIRLVLELVDGRRVLMEADGEKVTWSHALYAELLELLGSGCVRVAMASTGPRRDTKSRRRTASVS